MFIGRVFVVVSYREGWLLVVAQGGRTQKSHSKKDWVGIKVFAPKILIKVSGNLCVQSNL